MRLVSRAVIPLNRFGDKVPVNWDLIHSLVKPDSREGKALKELEESQKLRCDFRSESVPLDEVLEAVETVAMVTTPFPCPGCNTPIIMSQDIVCHGCGGAVRNSSVEIVNGWEEEVEYHVRPSRPGKLESVITVQAGVGN